MVGVGHESGDEAHHGDRGDLEVRVLVGDLAFVEGDEAVLLLAGVQVFDDALLDEVCPGDLVLLELLDVLLGEQRHAVLDDDERAPAASAVRLDDDLVGVLVVADVDDVAYRALPAFGAHLLREADRVLGIADELAVEEDFSLHC